MASDQTDSTGTRVGLAPASTAVPTHLETGRVVVTYGPGNRLRAPGLPA
jgi:hypothetical protein